MEATMPPNVEELEKAWREHLEGLE